MARATGHIHAAPLTSPRLRRVLAALSDGRPRTTREIVRKANVVAVSAVIAELRQHGAVIACVRQVAPEGWRYLYTMTKAPRPQ